MSIVSFVGGWVKVVWSVGLGSGGLGLAGLGFARCPLLGFGSSGRFGGSVRVLAWPVFWSVVVGFFWFMFVSIRVFRWVV